MGHTTSPSLYPFPRISSTSVMLFAADAVGEMHENGKGPRTELKPHSKS